MKVAPLITVALILCIAIPSSFQAKKKPKPNQFCVGKDGNRYEVGKGYDDKDGKVCVQYKCVKKNKKKFVMKKGKCSSLSVDGEWSDWSRWSACTSTCGDATKTRKRTCSNPPPSDEGRPCPGMKEEIEECALPSCGSPVEKVNVTALELNVQSLNESMQTLQATMQSMLELMTTLLSTANKQGTCLSDLSSSDCPSSAAGKVGIVDGIASNTAGVRTNTADLTSSKAGIATNKAGISLNKNDITSNTDTCSSIQATATKLETCLGDVNSVNCPTSEGGKTSLSDAIMENKDALVGHHPGQTDGSTIQTTTLTPTTTSTADVCDIDPSDRVECGWPGISKSVCEKRGCCFNDSPYNSRWCFQKPAGPVLLHTDTDYNYYKIPVPASLQMLSTVIATTCSNFGMLPQCYHENNADKNCIKAPSTSIHWEHPKAMSKILCDTTRPQDCASTVNMFWYMKPSYDITYGACGATKAGGFCSWGKDYTSTSEMLYFAACLKPVIPGGSIMQTTTPTTMSTITPTATGQILNPVVLLTGGFTITERGERDGLSVEVFSPWKSGSCNKDLEDIPYSQRRYDHTIHYYKGDIIMCGGRNTPGNCLYLDTNQKFVEHSRLLTNRFYHLGGVVGDEILLVGGSGHKNSVESWDGSQWITQPDKEVEGSKDETLACMAVISTDTFFIAGRDNEMLKYRDGVWEKLENYPGPKRQGPGCAFIKTPEGDAFIIAGGRKSFDEYLDSSYLYNIRKKHWEEVGKLKTARGYGKVLAVNEKVIMVGGLPSNTEDIVDVEEYNVVTKTWNTIQQKIKRGRHQFDAVVVPGNLVGC